MKTVFLISQVIFFINDEAWQTINFEEMLAGKGDRDAHYFVKNFWQKEAESECVHIVYKEKHLDDANEQI